MNGDPLPLDEARKLAQEMLDGLEDVTPGPWGYEDDVNPELLTAGTDEEGAYVYVVDGDIDVARNRSHIARCSPENIALLCRALGATAAPDTQAPAVKALEWNARNRADVYAIKDGYCEPTRWFLSRAGNIIDWFDTIDDAKAAAQADYEKRVNSALIPQADTAALDVLREVERLRGLLTDILREVQEWVDGVERGTSWDYWDHHYKYFAYGGLDNYRAALAQPAEAKGCLTQTTITTRNDEAGYTETVNEDVPTIGRELIGRGVEILLDMQTRRVVGYRLHDAQPAEAKAVAP